MPVRLARIPAALALVAIAIFAGWRARELFRQARWGRTVAAAEPRPPDASNPDAAAASLVPDEKPPYLNLVDPGRRDGSAEALDRAAATYVDQILPPHHAEAADLWTQAIGLEPLEAQYWYRLARERISLGQLDLARPALRRSDELDPNFPRQRMGAIQLWGVLGDRERSISLAKRIGSLGGTWRGEAAANLAALGVPAEEAFSHLDGDRLPPKEQLAILEQLHPGDVKSAGHLFERLNLAFYSTTSLRDALARWASNPLLFGAAQELWAAEFPGVELLGNRIPADNIKLMRSPFSTEFFYGWQRFPDTYLAEPRWLPSEPGSLFAEGHIEVGFLDRRPLDAFEWVFYRFPVKANSPFRVSIRLKNLPPGGAQCSLSARVDGKSLGKTDATASTDLWQTINLDVPAQDKAALCELVVQASILFGSREDANPPQVWIGALDFWQAPSTAAKGGS